MAQFDSFAPFSHTSASDVAQETPRYALSFEEEILQYSQSRQLRQSQQPRTEQLVKVTGPIYDISSRTATTTEFTPTTHPLPTLATTPSLVSALRSTIQPPPATRSRIVVIPGARKTGALQQDVTKKKLHPQLRLGIIMGMMLFMFCVTLISLAPLSDAQHGGVFFLGVMSGGQARQYAWSIPSHDATIQQGGATTNSNNAGAAMGGMGAPAAPVAPPPVFLPKSQYVAIAQQDAIAVGISPDYFVRQINQESGFNPNAYSPAGAIGIAQFIPSTAAGLGINPYDPVQALRGAANLMASYARQYGGDYAKALAAYNAGGGTVNFAVNTCGTSWLSCLPGETRNYIHVIMGI